MELKGCKFLNVESPSDTSRVIAVVYFNQWQIHTENHIGQG